MSENTKNTNGFKPYLQMPFITSFALLAIFAILMPSILKALNVATAKTPLPLRKSFDLIDESRLEPYKVLSKDKIGNAEILESLGTHDYIQWVLEDTTAESGSPTRYCMLFITYYDRPDRVPHVPEECYTGGGNQIIDQGPVEFKVTNMPDVSGEETLPGKYLQFSKTSANLWQGTDIFSVLYLFKVNGEYANSRGQVRLMLNKNIFNEHSYFCKVEWKFSNTGEFGRMIYPSKEEAVVASEKLLSAILPVLEEDHWPTME